MLKPVAALLVALVELYADPVMFRGDPAHSGVYVSATTPTLASVKWKFKAAGKIISSPAVADGTAYFGSTAAKLYAVDTSNGTLRWTFQAQGPVNSSPLVSGGNVYFSSVDGNFYAVDSTTGKLAWKFKTEGERRFTAPGIHGMIPKHEMIPIPSTSFCLRRQSPTARSTSAVATTTSTPSTQRRAL